MEHYINILPLKYIQYDLGEYLKPSKPSRPEFAPDFYHCLPMVSANTLGWTLYNPFEFTVTWKMGPQASAVIVEGENPDWARSWFGFATFSIHPQFLVRTPPNIDLLIRPVPNHFKHMVQTLEGMVESDWIKSSFTLNFRMTMPSVKVTFKVGEPLVQLIPYPRNFIENFEANIVTDDEDYEVLLKQFSQWQEERQKDIDDNNPHQLHYMRGQDLDGSIIADHKKAFKLPSFKPRAAK